MPIIRIEMLEGRSKEMKLSLIQEVTDAMSRSLNIEKEEIDIIIQDVSKENWAKGGVLLPSRKVKP